MSILKVNLNEHDGVAALKEHLASINTPLDVAAKVVEAFELQETYTKEVGEHAMQFILAAAQLLTLVSAIHDRGDKPLFGLATEIARAVTTTLAEEMFHGDIPEGMMEDYMGKATHLARVSIISNPIQQNAPSTNAVQ